MPEMSIAKAVTKTHPAHSMPFYIIRELFLGMVLLVSNITAALSDVKGVTVYSPAALFRLNNSS